MKKLLTLAQLKRDVKSEKLEGLMVIRCGKSQVLENIINGEK